MADALADRVAVVTGGASGIGRACAVRLAAEGADVVVADLHADRGAETVAAIELAGRRGLFVRTDTSQEADNEALAEAAVAEFGGIDILVAAAGISHAAYVSGEASDYDRRADPTVNYVLNASVESWERVLAVNLTGVMLTNRAIARRMVERGRGGRSSTLRRARPRSRCGARQTTASPRPACGCLRKRWRWNWASTGSG